MKVLSCVGTGAFGTVLKINIQEQIFALKQINLEFNTDEDSSELEAVRTEAKLMQKCFYHPNIVRYYHSFRRGDHYFILMQFVQGCTLTDMPTPLNQSQLLTLVIQLALALHHLKKHSIVHRDIKPSNILISENGLIKIADLGISKSLSINEDTSSCLGTPFYTAPQIFNQNSYDYAVDVWSLGVVIYEAAHGVLPFVGRSIEELKKAVKHYDPKIDNSLPVELKMIIKGCLHKNAAHRLTVQQILFPPNSATIVTVADNCFWLYSNIMMWINYDGEVYERL